jgi:hypothetical protein
MSRAIYFLLVFRERAPESIPFVLHDRFSVAGGDESAMNQERNRRDRALLVGQIFCTDQDE